MLVVARVGYFPRNILQRGMVSMTALRFQSFSLFSPFTREGKRFENVFENVSKHFEGRFHSVPFRYRFRALSCKR